MAPPKTLHEIKLTLLIESTEYHPNEESLVKNVQQSLWKKLMYSSDTDDLGSIRNGNIKKVNFDDHKWKPEDKRDFQDFIREEEIKKETKRVSRESAKKLQAKLDLTKWTR